MANALEPLQQKYVRDLRQSLWHQKQIDIFLLILSKYNLNILSYYYQKATSFYILCIEPYDT